MAVGLVVEVRGRADPCEIGFGMVQGAGNHESPELLGHDGALS